MRHIIIFLFILLPSLVLAKNHNEMLEGLSDEISMDSYVEALNICQSIMDEDQSTSMLYGCEAEVSKNLEAVLDQFLDDAKIKFDDSEAGRELRGRFMMAHGSWLSLRTSECQFKGGLRRLGGSGEGIDILRCHNQMTVNRINDYSHLEL